MDFAIDVARIPTLVAGIATLLMGAIVIGMAPRAPLHRAFGLFFGLRGLMLVLQSMGGGIGTSLPGRLSVYVLIALPFSAVWLAHTFLRRHGRHRSRSMNRVLGVSLLATAGILEGAYFFDHDLFFGGSLLRAPLILFYSLQFVCYAGIALLTGREFLRLPPSEYRRSLYAFTIAFLAEPTYHAVYLAAAAPAIGIPDSVDGFANYVLPTITLFFVVIAAVATVRLLRRTEQDRHDRWRALTLQGLAAGTAVAIVAVNLWMRIDTDPIQLFFVLNAFWILVAVIGTAYAILRYRFFTMDLRVKVFLRYGSTAFLTATAFLFISETLETYIPAQTLLTSLVATAAVAVVLYPVHRLTRRLAERLMPGVADTQEYRRHRRSTIYRAALEGAMLDGFITPEEETALEVLWKSLGLSGKEARSIEKEVLGARPAALSGSAGPTPS
jgi:hypothetical protein